MLIFFAIGKIQCKKEKKPLANVLLCSIIVILFRKKKKNEFLIMVSKYFKNIRIKCIKL